MVGQDSELAMVTGWYGRRGGFWAGHAQALSVDNKTRFCRKMIPDFKWQVDSLSSGTKLSKNQGRSHLSGPAHMIPVALLAGSLWHWTSFVQSLTLGWDSFSSFTFRLPRSLGNPCLCFLCFLVDPAIIPKSAFSGDSPTKPSFGVTTPEDQQLKPLKK